ncbi:MAG: hydrogenase maturation nickel metallochaperone HypA [Sideroxydans sp.]|nr:hydrogenase maturation nickel metallochaperone HypA [Sideroxydans sp.]
MHEMSLAQNVREIIEQAALDQGFTQVKTVWLEIGRLSCVEQEAMRFCFGAAMQGSVAEAAQLEIIDTPGRGLCRNCGHEAEIENVYDTCPHCGSYGLQLVAGDAMRVKELEVE